jgi:glutathione S-transferase
MHSGFGTLRSVCSMTCGQRVVLRERPAALETELQRLRSLWTEGLTRFGGPFLAGATFTAVDAFFAPVAFRLQTYGLRLDTAPDAPADAYTARLLALPAMRDWYEAALREPWREASHEEDIVRVAASITELRHGPP